MLGLRVAKRAGAGYPTRHCDQAIVLNGVGYKQKTTRPDSGSSILCGQRPMRFALPAKDKADQRTAPHYRRDWADAALAYQDRQDSCGPAGILIA